MAPDVCDIVKYGLDSFGKKPATYRVDGWLKPYVKPFKVTGYDMLLSGAMRADLDRNQWAEVLLQDIFDGMDEEAPRGSRLAWCARESATHVALSSICGAVAPVSECKVIGRVRWSDEAIQEQVEYAHIRAKEGKPTDCYR